MAINYAKISTDELVNIIDAIRPVVAGRDASAVTMACITIAALMYKPAISFDDLASLVKGVSEYIALATMPTPDKVN